MLTIKNDHLYNLFIFLALGASLICFDSQAQKNLSDTLKVLTLEADEHSSEEYGYFYKTVKSSFELYDNQDTSFNQLGIQNLKVLGEWSDYETKEISSLVIQQKREGFWEEFYMEFEIPASKIELHCDSLNAPNLIQVTYDYRISFNRGEDQGIITEFWNFKTKERIARLYLEHYHHGSFHDPSTATTSAILVEYEAEIEFNKGFLTVKEIKNFDGSFNYDTNQVETVLYKHDALMPKAKYRLINNRFIKQ